LNTVTKALEVVLLVDAVVSKAVVVLLVVPLLVAVLNTEVVLLEVPSEVSKVVV
jgi:hypothetical protein